LPKATTGACCVSLWDGKWVGSHVPFAGPWAALVLSNDKQRPPCYADVGEERERRPPSKIDHGGGVSKFASPGVRARVRACV
jgi:hypothetical protein